VIIIDESQFLTKEQVKQLAYICDNFNIPIICHGLKNSYLDGELFEGSAALLYYADKIEETKNICKCGRKATMNLRILNGKPIYDGNIINCGDTKPTDDYYIPVCRKHYFEPQI
jgi:thymidine kinase